MAIDRSKQINTFLAKLPDVKPQTVSLIDSVDEKISATFTKINDFFIKNGREPMIASVSFQEKQLATLLKSLRARHSNNKTLLAMDRNKILQTDQKIKSSKLITEKAIMKNADMALVQNEISKITSKSSDSNEMFLASDDSIGSETKDISAFLDKLDSEPHEIFELKHVKNSAKKLEVNSNIAQRVICDNFNEYAPLFTEVNQQLENGTREIIRFANESKLKKGEFFILNGVTAYIADVGKEYRKNGKINARLKIIYSNGMQANNLKRSFARELYKDASGRRIVEPLEIYSRFSNTLKKEDTHEGTVYVLQSLSEENQIQPIRERIHKIGFTKNSVKSRIANAKRDPTYLLAEVKIVAQYKVYNLKASKIEKILQTYFRKAQAEITIGDRFGVPVHPTEWFFVDLAIIKEAVDRLLDGSLKETYYDTDRQKIISKKSE